MRYIEEAHNSYLNTVKDKLPPYQRDTTETVRVGVTVCVSMLSICIKNLKIAA